MARSTAITSLR